MDGTGPGDADLAKASPAGFISNFRVFSGPHLGKWPVYPGPEDRICTSWKMLQFKDSCLRNTADG